MRRLLLFVVSVALAASALSAQPAAPPQVTAIRAGRLLDPEAGRILTNQIIVIDGTRIRDVGPNVAIPPGAQLIDLSG
jgi:imidazolonepropionase-like amidohydrolase